MAGEDGAKRRPRRRRSWRTPNTPRRTDDTCCTTAFAAFAMEGKGQRANNFARLYFVPSSLLSSFQLVFFYSAAPPAGREQHRKRTGREVCLCALARTAGPADRAALNRAPCISQRAQAVQPTGFGWFCLCGFAPLRFVWSIRSGAGGRYEDDGGGKGADVRNWSPDGVEVRSEETWRGLWTHSLRSGAERSGAN